MIQLKDELAACDCKLDADAYRETLANVFANMFPGWTDEEMLCDEFAPRRFVEAIRRKTKAPDLPHSLVLRSLLNIRKRGNL